ncbi:unnamed protein product [Aphanomyces euteiches]
MFTKFACPAYRDTLVASVRKANMDDPNELDEAVNTLITLTGTGVHHSKKGKNKETGHSNMATWQPQNIGGRGGRGGTNNRGRGKSNNRGGRNNGRGDHYTQAYPLVIETKNRKNGTAAAATGQQLKLQHPWWQQRQK